MCGIAETSGGRAVVVLADSDHFKRVNARYGHGAGDAVLARMAGVLQSELRAADLQCRYGGEAFAMVLSETNHDGAQVIVQRLRRIIVATD